MPMRGMCQTPNADGRHALVLNKNAELGAYLQHHSISDKVVLACSDALKGDIIQSLGHQSSFRHQLKVSRSSGDWKCLDHKAVRVEAS